MGFVYPNQKSERVGLFPSPFPFLFFFLGGLFIEICDVGNLGNEPFDFSPGSELTVVGIEESFA